MPVLLFNKLAFVPIFLLSCYYLFTGRIKSLAPVILVSIFLFGFIVSFLFPSDFSLSLQFVLSSLSVLAIYPIIEMDIDIELIIKKVGAAFALTICFFSLILLISPASALGQYFIYFYNSNNLGFYGERDFGGITIFMLHHRCSPFLLIPLCIFTYKYFLNLKFTDIFFAVIVFIAITFTASRALIAMGLISVIAIYFMMSKIKARLILFVIMLPISYLTFNFISSSSTIFSSGEVSNSVKLGHLYSFFESLDLQRIVFGRGLGSYYYSSGVNAEAAQTEITIIDSIRYFGIPFTIILFMAIFFPFGNKIILNRRYQFALVAFTLYIFMSLSNPILFNSFGFLVIIWYWKECFYSKERLALKTNKLKY